MWHGSQIKLNINFNFKFIELDFEAAMIFAVTSVIMISIDHVIHNNRLGHNSQGLQVFVLDSTL